MSIMIPNGYHRIAANSNANGTMIVTMYFNKEHRKLFLTIEQEGHEHRSLGPFDPSFLDILCTMLGDVHEMHGRYYAV
jgi:hypothetical protein